MLHKYEAHSRVPDIHPPLSLLQAAPSSTRQRRGPPEHERGTLSGGPDFTASGAPACLSCLFNPVRHLQLVVVLEIMNVSICFSFGAQ